jgi:hypothetical protein
MKANWIHLATMILAAAVLSATARAGAEPKTLTRTEDPVVVKASHLDDLKDVDIAKLALVAMTGDAFKPIPFQVDERAKDGKFVYDKGPKADPSQGDKKYNGEDELVFMAWDMGDKAKEDAKPPCESKRAAEIEISDGKGKAWVYLFECAANPPKSDKDYVRHEQDAERDWVKTDRYAFSEKRGTSFFDRLCLRGDDGKVGPNMVDRIKGRGHMEVKVVGTNIDTPESDLKGSLQAYLDGPVRVVHLMTAYIEIALVKLNLGGQSENLYYSNYFVTPIQVNTPVNPGSVLSKFTMRYAIDWRKEFEGTKYYDSVNTKGVVLDGKMDEDEKKLDYTAEHNWYALAGPHGNMVVHTTMPEQWRKLVKLGLYYVDDVTALDPPEEDPGQRCPGFTFALSEIPAGKYQYSIFYMFPDKAPPASVPTMLDIVDHPLKTDGDQWP